MECEIQKYIYSKDWNIKSLHFICPRSCSAKLQNKPKLTTKSYKELLAKLPAPAQSLILAQEGDALYSS
jgi:hypothetical protein